MKVFLHAVFFFSLLMGSAVAFGVTPDMKVYVSKEDIFLTDKGMLLKIGDGYIRIHTLHTDEKGFWVSKNTYYNSYKQRYFEKGKSW